jgi:tetratricopeptide (TPR) repeat protein
MAGLPNWSRRNTSAKDGLPVIDRYLMLARLQLLAGFGCALVVVYAFQFHSSGTWVRIAAVGIMIAAAALLLGFLFGFIFCYPRVKKNAGELKPSSDSVEDNPSLADISDWLTKIMVGVGLVELNKIPSSLWLFSGVLATGLRTVDSGPYVDGSQTFCLGLILFFFIVGFLIGHIWTRFYYQEALKRGIEAAIRDEKLDKKHKLDAWELSEKASTLTQLERFDEASRISDEALSLDAQNPKALFEKGRALKKLADQGNRSDEEKQRLYAEALSYASQAATLSPWKAAPAYNIACYQALLRYPVMEIERNLRRAIELNPALAEAANNDPDLEEVRSKYPHIKKLITDNLPKSRENDVIS